MPFVPPIFLAAGEDSIVDVVVWLVAGAIWIFSQMAAAKKKQARKARPPGAAPAAGATTPTPDELADIFRRLGADIPGTPPPQPSPPPAAAAVSRPAIPRAKSTPPRPPAPKSALRKPPPARPDLARRLARVRQEAAEAARRAKTESVPGPASLPDVRTISGEPPGPPVSSRHTGMVLPRLYAMNLRLAPLPVLPMPGFGPAQEPGTPLRANLHSRRQVRNAIVVQTFLQPARAGGR